MRRRRFERTNLLRLSVFEDLKIIASEVVDWLAVLAGGDNIQHDQSRIYDDAGLMREFRAGRVRRAAGFLRRQSRSGNCNNCAKAEQRYDSRGESFRGYGPRQ